MRLKYFFGFIIAFGLLFTGCKKDDNNPDDNTFNLFTIEDDLELGAQFDREIRNSPNEYPIVDSAQYSEAYGYLYNIRDRILAGGNVFYDERFPWRMTLIKDDSTLNAFCTPGGYIYVYTGLIKYLDNESQFAGVVGHEMAHADRRHSTDQLTKQYGLSLLIQIVAGDDEPGALTQIAASLATLSFSRSDETEADEYSVRYLNPTEYDARGVAGFFQKLEEQSSGVRPPQFLSTHPSPANRVEDIMDTWEKLGSKEGNEFPERYQDLINSLP